MSPGITVNISSARSAVMCVVSTTNTAFLGGCLFVAMLLLSPCVFVASPPFLLQPLNAVIPLSPLLTAPLMFGPTGAANDALLFSSAAAVACSSPSSPAPSSVLCEKRAGAGEGWRSGRGGYLAAAISGFISCIILLVISPLSLPPLSRAAIEVATSRSCNSSQERLDGGGGFQLPPADRDGDEHRVLKLFLFQGFCSFHLNALILCVCVCVLNTPTLRLCDFRVRASPCFNATRQQMAAVLGAAARKLKRSAAAAVGGRVEEGCWEVAGM